MQPIPNSPEEALRIFLDKDSEDWERDLAARGIGAFEAGRVALLATARNPTEDEMLQRRAAEVLAWYWRDEGTLQTADLTGFTTSALEEIELHRRDG